jgi:serine/threonine protein kinase
MTQDTNLPAPGDVLAGKYRIERLIGRGGMGAVFAAQHMLLNQRVALKLLLGELADSKEASARFMNEARAAAQIQGEHVARVLDIGQLPNGAPFMVLEYLEGADLSGVLQQRGPLPVTEVADYALQALDALAQAHAAGIVHRDLKPANLFLTRRHDGTTLVKVLDFGISKNLAASATQGMTSTRAVLGSPEYMSPEQLRTPRGVDARTDIWSLGVILYELLTGRMPFTGESLAELFVQILETVPPPVRSIRPDIPAALETVIARCMMRDPAGRYQNVSELKAELMFFASDQARAMAFARGSAPGIHAMAANQSGPMPVSTANTAAPWAGTMGQPPTAAKRSRKVAIVAVSILGLGVGGVGSSILVRAFMNHDAPATAETASSNATTDGNAPPPSATTTIPATAADSNATKDAGKPSHTVVTPPAPRRDVPPTPPQPAVTPPPFTPPAQRVPTQPATPAAPAKNCSPNYYFDKDGNKHFKPECF